jgi:hypothetical protein
MGSVIPKWFSFRQRMLIRNQGLATRHANHHRLWSPLGLQQPQLGSVCVCVCVCVCTFINLGPLLYPSYIFSNHAFTPTSPSPVHTLLSPSLSFVSIETWFTSLTMRNWIPLSPAIPVCSVPGMNQSFVLTNHILLYGLSMYASWASTLTK